MRVPEQLMRAMAAEAEAARNARAKVVLMKIRLVVMVMIIIIVIIMIVRMMVKMEIEILMKLLYAMMKLLWTHSKVIAAEGEHKASRALRHAADVISENPAALQVTMSRDFKKVPCTPKYL